MYAQKIRSRIHHLMQYRRQVTVIVVLSLAAIPLIPFRVSAVLQDSVWVATFTPGEALNAKLKQAAHVRPSPAQIKWMERERNAFLHYNMNTFHGADWGTGSEAETDFAPTAQNPDQFAQVVKDGKFSMVVPTVKHHDGFCIWNTATTNHCIRNATVKTDVVAALHTGCVNHGIDLGIYLSPWDMNQRNAGCWTTNASDTVCYNNFFINQLKELLGGTYGASGTIGELWFDGACGDYTIWLPIPGYRTKRWYDTIETLQPNAVIRLYDGFYFSGTITDSSEWTGIKAGTQKLKWRGKEIRWCGNEGGTGRADEWSVEPVYSRFFGSDQQNNTLGQESFYNNAVGAVWYQSEVNTSIAANGQWFWHTGGYTLKTLSDLQTLYYNSLGNNANLLLNLLPDNRGLIANDQIALLKTWNNWIDSTFTKNWAKGATATATAVNATPEVTGHEANKIIDNNKNTYWTTGGTWNIDNSTATVTFVLPAAQTFDHVMIKEYVYDGQRVAGWSVDYLNGTTWTSLVSGKKVIGYKRISKFNQVTASQVRLNITRSWDNPEISNFALYRTLSGIDTTPEVGISVPPAVKAMSIAKQPQITVAAHRLTIDAMGLRISRIEIVRPDGRSIPLSMTSGLKAVSRPLTPGVYLVQIQAGDRTFQNKIVVSR
ncbi:MAG: alpha-L-fucosidase [Chitinispirillaceae bacterium]|jgi:alpha-L-fucosidase